MIRGQVKKEHTTINQHQAVLTPQYNHSIKKWKKEKERENTKEKCDRSSEQETTKKNIKI